MADVAPFRGPWLCWCLQCGDRWVEDSFGTKSPVSWPWPWRWYCRARGHYRGLMGGTASWIAYLPMTGGWPGGTWMPMESLAAMPFLAPARAVEADDAVTRLPVQPAPERGV